MAVVEKARSLRAKAEPTLVSSQNHNADAFGGGSSGLVAGGALKNGAAGESSSSKPAVAQQDPDAVIRRVAKQGALSEFAAAAAAMSQLGRARSPSEAMDDVFDQGNFNFVNRFASSKLRPNRGLWSQFGRAYVANGTPDLELTDNAKRLRQAQRDKRSKKGGRHYNAPSRERGGNSITPTDGATMDSSSRRRVSPAIELLNQTKALKTKHVKLRRETDFSRYSFPKRVLREADRRYQQSKNGASFGMLVEQEVDALGALFPLLEISDAVTIDESNEL